MFLPHLESMTARFGLCIGGILLVAIGSGFYLRCGLGPGPRDGLMTGIARISGWPLGAARGVVEVTVLILGWLLGGVAGIGTLLFAVFIGPCVHVAVRLLSRIPDDHL